MLIAAHRKIWPLLYLLLYAHTSQAQECSAISFSIRNGLAGDNIYWMTQDHDGFLWVATETGISRFDGTAFRNYTRKDGLPNNDICALFVDRRNRVWMMPFKKEICYYANGKIHNRQNDALVRNIRLSSEEKTIAEDAAGNLLVETDSNIVLIDTGDRCHTFAKPYSGRGFFMPQSTIGRISAGIIDTSLQKYQDWYYYRYVYNRQYPMGNGRFATVGYGKKIAIFSPDGAKRYIPAPADLSTIESFDDSSLIICTRHGCFLYNTNTYRIIHTLLQDLSVNICYRDREGGIWIGTNGAGMYYVPSIKNKNITHTPGNSQLQVFHFYNGRNAPVAGTNNWQFWQLDSNATPVGKLINSRIDAKILLSPEGNMQKNLENSMVKILADAGKIPAFVNGCKSVTNIGDTIIACAARGLVYRFVLHGKIIDTARWNGRLTCAMYKDGRYYAGTLEGLYTFTGKDKEHTAANARQLVNAGIYSIADCNNQLWIATTDNGVYCLEQDKVIKHFNEANGLSGNICTCIFTDGNNVYVGTTDGINIIRPRNHFSIERYYTIDGLVSNNISCIYASGNGLWAGTSEGLSYLSVTGRPGKTYCRLVFTDINVSGKSLDITAAPFTLSPHAANIRLSWSGICFRSMGKMKYAYRLRGLDDAWQTTDQNYLQYPSLPAGDYVFEIYAINRYDVASAKQRIMFTIQKQWWQYWWIQLSGLLCFIAAVAGLAWWRIHRIHQREQEKIKLKEKIIELEQLALRAQMNPHFIFNSLNSFYQYVITKDLAGASRFMNDFSRLVRMLFETTSLTEIPLDKELDFLATYLSLERTKLNDSFTYDFYVQPGIQAADIIIPSFIIQPFIENSIRHGIQNRHDDQGRIVVSIHTEGDFMTVHIDDNGRGRQYTADLKSRLIPIGNSKGIALTGERIALYNKTHHTDIRFVITDKYEKGIATGTLVIIYFPLNDIT